MKTLRTLLPGLALVAVVTAIAYVINLLVPALSALLVAILLGMLVRNIGLVPATAEAGLTFVSKKVLRAGVVLLGFQLSLRVIVDLGLGALLTILVTVVGTFVGTLAIGRLLNMDTPDRYLVATGTSICGASAIAAMSAVVDNGKNSRRVEESAATALAGVTIFGTISMLALPAIINATGMGAMPAGVWIGSAIHEVGQVVAGGGFVSPEVQQVAVATKLGRVLTLAPMVVLVGLAMRRRTTMPTGAASEGSDIKAPPLVPLFVAGFLAMVILRTVLDLPDSHALPTTINLFASLFLTAAMVGMGAAVDIRSVLSRGRTSILLSLIAGILATLISLAGVLLFL
ncbi:putative integral membrane protein (TIGR00698 family) [Trueperella bonasi]|uniref:Integral membrane protein (TIGR00698 family) n=1 Tax=Trueperella bonasi TaxID=312286 RepID=A0ABT9NI27_9ACTO|nr:putative sulfate exporter family transporter [Trueperella bonasi]MDP9806850.1 putative integral membrane protein (TIGR00698 family) [Trueperella bonasi]